MIPERAQNPQAVRPGQPILQMGGPGGNFPPGQQAGSPPMQGAGPRIDSYYSSLAIVATSPREISVIFGRYLPMLGPTGEQGIAPVFEKQILMTVEQVEDLVKILGKAAEDFRARRAEAEARAAETPEGSEG